VGFPAAEKNFKKNFLEFAGFFQKTGFFVQALINNFIKENRLCP